MVAILIGVGLLVAVFVGFNIGGSNTGPAFGPAVGAGAVTKVFAGVLMSVFFFVGAWTIGRRVVNTLGRDLVNDPGVFTVETSIIVLFFIGGALFIGNYVGVPASTSMTAVGSIAGLGVAAGELNWVVMGEIAVWWIVAPLVGFWVSVMIGRYVYPTLNQWVAITSSEGALVELDRSGAVPVPRPGPNTTRREFVGTLLLVSIGCLMAFSSGTSNIANAIAPLYGAGMNLNLLILVGSGAVAVGALTIARRTLDTIGNDLTDLPLTAAIVVAVVASAIVIGLSAIGIPASFVIIATMCIIGLGWGRATRTVSLTQSLQGAEEASVTVGALAADEPGDEPPKMGTEEPRDLPDAADLFDPTTTGRVVLMQNLVPVISTVGAYVTFFLVFRFF